MEIAKVMNNKLLIKERGNQMRRKVVAGNWKMNMLPNEAIDFIEKLDIVSLDIKLPEHFNNDFDKDIFINEIKSVNLLMAKSIMLYCKVVVLPSTKTNLIQEVMEKLSNNISSKNKLQIIIQPSSPLEDWGNSNSKLFEFSEIVGQYFEVSTIPQVHKILNIE